MLRAPFGLAVVAEAASSTSTSIGLLLENEQLSFLPPLPAWFSARDRSTLRPHSGEAL